MAKKAMTLIKTKKKTQRRTKSETFLVNQKYLGSDEPDISKLSDRSAYTRALSWYGSMSEPDEARNYLITFLSDYSTELRNKIARIPDKAIPRTAAWIARLSARGLPLTEKQIDFILAKCEQATSLQVDIEDKPATTNVLSIKERTKDRCNEIIGDIEVLIDQEEPFSTYDYLQKNQIPALYVPKIIAYYVPFMDEMELASKEKIEGLDQHPKKWYREKAAMFASIIEDAQRHAGVAKKTRKLRKPKTITSEKMLKHFKFQKESSEYKMVSINPEKIIGAQELIVFNTKYRSVTHFIAIDRGGLKINRSSIINYNETESATYKTGRKTDALVHEIANASKAGLKKILAKLKKTTLATRSNEATLLLKTIS